MSGRCSRALRAGAVAVSATLLLSGCSAITLADLPLPGGEGDVGGAYHVTVEFRDVMDLVEKSAVEVNDVTVGDVEDIKVDGWKARVRLRVKKDIVLPANTVALLRQTSLLGEKYVSLERPTDEKAVGRLADGALIPLARSGRNTEIEEVFSALSLLLNGGGVAQLKTINVELAKAMTGRESELRAFLRELGTFVGTMDQQKVQIQRALDGLDALSSRVSAQRQVIGRAIDGIGPAMKVLADQRSQLTAMLTGLSDLGDVSARVIRASKDDTVASLRSLSPVLGKLAEAGDALPNALQVLLTYPFPDAAMEGIKGDFTNLHVTADLDLGDLFDNLIGKPMAPVGRALRSLPKTVDGTLQLVCKTARQQANALTNAVARGQRLRLVDQICGAIPAKPVQTTLNTVCSVLYPTGLLVAGLGTLCEPPKSGSTFAPAPTPSPVPSPGSSGLLCLPGLVCIPNLPLNQTQSGAASSDLARLLLKGVG